MFLSRVKHLINVAKCFILFINPFMILILFLIPVKEKLLAVAIKKQDDESDVFDREYNSRRSKTMKK